MIETSRFFMSRTWDSSLSPRLTAASSSLNGSWSVSSRTFFSRASILSLFRCRTACWAARSVLRWRVANEAVSSQSSGSYESRVTPYPSLTRRPLLLDLRRRHDLD